MESQSPRRFAVGSIEVEASPVSNIVNDLCRSTLNSAGAKKRRHPHSFRDVFGASHCINGQGSERFFSSVSANNKCPSTTMSADLILDLDHQQSSDGLLKCGDGDCDKENCNAPDFLLNSSLQKVHCRKLRFPLQDCRPNKNKNKNYEVDDLVDNNEEMQCDDTVSRRMSMDSQYSPVQSSRPMVSCSQSRLLHMGTSTSCYANLRRLSSGYDSMDDGPMNDLIDIEAMEDDMQLPSDISKLLSGNIVAPETSMECDVSTTPEFCRSKLSAKVRWLSNRCLQSQVHKPTSPPISKIRTCLFRSPPAACSPKLIRNTPEEPGEGTRNTEAASPLSTGSKRPSEDLLRNEIAKVKKSRHSNSFCATPVLPGSPTSSPWSAHPKLQRSVSETEAHIKWAVQRSSTDADLIGDFSKPCVLPLTGSNHTDLKSITPDTLAALLRGEFADRVGSYRLVDCRYPYEYDAGHIEGALNLYNKDLVEQSLLEPLSSLVPEVQPDDDKRHILVFHCEFSWERGPNLSRFLRSLDRQRNKEHYPALHYPEIYLLHGGYEKFYTEQKEFCSPQEYKPMRHPDHTEECKLFRSKSKSWQGGKSSRGNPAQTGRHNLKRLGF